jgi:ribosomal protein S18 acetylase RimI-like enzyme
MNPFTIRKVQYEELDSCVRIIRESFGTVAEEFQLTVHNCPTNGAFIQLERLVSDWNKGNVMFGLYCDDDIVGFIQLECKSSDTYELEKLAVLPEYRHRGYGSELLKFARQAVEKLGAQKITIGIIEENVQLKKWYQEQGFIHKGIKKFDHLPFTVGFMEQNIPEITFD